MKRKRNGMFAVVFGAMLAVILSSPPAAAETTIPVNDDDTGIFDQPSVAMSGSTAHLAYIGDDSGSGAFRVYYAAVNGAADFTNLTLPRDNTVLLTFPTVLDNTGSGGNSPYFDARHPKIAVRSSSEAVILFQARPTSLSTVFRPYIARLTLSGNSVTAQSVRQVTGFPAGPLSTGTIEDLSFGLAAVDNTARAAFSNKSSIGAAEPSQVYFARVGLDNALVAGTPLPLSSGAPPLGSNGFLPLPSLKLDNLNRAHVAWAADDSSTAPNGIYYALVKETNGVDNVVIAATEVLTRTLSFGHPNLLVASRSSIVVLAADESQPGLAGSIGMVNINPDADDQDGSPALVGTNSFFFLTPPGQAVLPSNFDLYRPEAFLTSSARIHITGYGNNGTRATYYSFRLTGVSPFVEMLSQPAQAGSESPPEFPEEIAGDYTRAAIGFLNGKVVVFWSGEIASGGNRNLDVTALAAASEPIPFEESGCSAAGNGQGGLLGGFLLLVPAALFALRRRFRRHGDG